MNIVNFNVFQEILVSEVPKLKKIKNVNLTWKLLKDHELKFLFQLFVPAHLKTEKETLGYDKNIFNHRYYKKTFFSR